MKGGPTGQAREGTALLREELSRLLEQFKGGKEDFGQVAKHRVYTIWGEAIKREDLEVIKNFLREDFRQLADITFSSYWVLLPLQSSNIEVVDLFLSSRVSLTGAMTLNQVIAEACDKNCSAILRRILANPDISLALTGNASVDWAHLNNAILDFSPVIVDILFDHGAKLNFQISSYQEKEAEKIHKLVNRQAWKRYQLVFLSQLDPGSVLNVMPVEILVQDIFGRLLADLQMNLYRGH